MLLIKSIWVYDFSQESDAQAFPTFGAYWRYFEVTNLSVMRLDRKYFLFVIFLVILIVSLVMRVYGLI